MQEHDVARLNRSRRLVVEALGCGLLVVALEGAHHGAEHLGVGATDGRLFMSLAAGAVLACLAFVLQPLTGAHFNPALTFADALEDGTPWRDVPLYVLAQLGGAVAGRLVAHVMCHEPMLVTAHEPAASAAQFATELVSTFGLLVMVRGCVRSRPTALPLVVAGYLAATIWFTESRALANPALILARAVSTRPSAVHPMDVESFIAAQLLGAALAVLLFRWLQRVPELKQARVWSVVFQCSKPEVAQQAVGIFNHLASPARAQATTQLRADDDEALPPLVVRLVLAGESPDAAGHGGASWQLTLPADAVSSEDSRVRAELRAPIHQLLRNRGWLRLYAVGDAAQEGPGGSR
ncbi:aquaporin [Myxococcus sp. 1LA]